ncbi:hypothetical protein [Epilithonimonas xixisoli]|nr:hypothetical protein [Epilithonimonas xixisoli]
MKIVILFLGLFFIFSCEKKNLNEKEVLEIIHSKKGFESMELKTEFLYGENFIDSIQSFRKIIKRENLKPIYETDLNNDGKQDYLVNLKHKKIVDDGIVVKILYEDDSKNCILLLSNSKGYKLLNPGKKRVYNIFSAKIISDKNQNLIKLINFKKNIDDRNDILEFDTLMLKNNQITEFSKSDQIHNIEVITLTKFGGYAPRKEFKLNLKKDSIILDSKFYKKLEGKYLGSKSENFKTFSKHLNDIDFTNLKNVYSIGCCDHSSIETTITYDKGKKKTIYDNGEMGTLGLVKFYDDIEKLMETEKWQKIN